MIKEKKILVFGAGKIGRSFIGQLFSRGGYEVVFVDIYKPIIDELNFRKSFDIIVKSENEERLHIKNVRGIHIDDRDQVISELSTAGIAAVSVGIKGQATVFPLISAALEARLKNEGQIPLDFILAENQRNADETFFQEIKKLLPSPFPIDDMLGLIETSIGKMVPIMTSSDLKEDPLLIFAEPYNTLILNRKSFKNTIPDIEGLAPKDNIKAWVDRKLFIHNLGHATAAYTGFLVSPGKEYLWEVLAIPKVMEKTRSAMIEASEILLKMYPGDFLNKDLRDHIDDLLERFQNRFLGDTVYRVGCDLMRKLAPDDRLSGAIKAAIQIGLPYDHILYGLVAGCRFKATDENGNSLPGDIDFRKIYSRGISAVLEEVCKFDRVKDKVVFDRARELDRLFGLKI